ncbi:hypothetical protein EC973_009192, partial [Apophysomyces ossiformis]
LENTNKWSNAPYSQIDDVKSDAAKIEKEFLESVPSEKRKISAKLIIAESITFALSWMLLTSVGCKPLSMPPYSSLLNAIEECWSKIKKNIRRNPLDKSDMVMPRITEAYKTVTAADCQ